MRKVLFLLLLLVACQLPQLQQLQRQKLPAIPDIMKGTSALEISFNANSMSNILMCREANILLDFKNTGAYNISGKYLFIMQEQFMKPIDSKSGVLSLEGKSLYMPKGGISNMVFKVQNSAMPEQLETFDTTLLFLACYPYKTFANAQVCIDTDLKNVMPKKACSPGVLSFSGGQGAPIAVTKVEPRMTPVKDQVLPIFAIYVQNLGDGTVVYEKELDSACAPVQKGVKLLSNITVQATLQGVAMDCQKSVTIMPGQESRIICQSTKPYGLDAGTFSTLLNIELSYGYVSAAVLPMTVTRVSGQVC